MSWGPEDVVSVSCDCEDKPTFTTLRKALYTPIDGTPWYVVNTAVCFDCGCNLYVKTLEARPDECSKLPESAPRKA